MTVYLEKLYVLIVCEFMQHMSVHLPVCMCVRTYVRTSIHVYVSKVLSGSEVPNASLHKRTHTTDWAGRKHRKKVHPLPWMWDVSSNLKLKSGFFLDVCMCPFCLSISEMVLCTPTGAGDKQFSPHRCTTSKCNEEIDGRRQKNISCDKCQRR